MRQLLTGSKQLGQILRSRRRALEMTQAQVAPKLALSQNRLSQIEANPNGVTVEQLLELLNVLSLDLVIEDRSSSKRVEW